MNIHHRFLCRCLMTTFRANRQKCYLMKFKRYRLRQKVFFFFNSVFKADFLPNILVHVSNSQLYERYFKQNNLVIAFVKCISIKC